jgi:ubiquinone biosynthesis protein
MFRAVRNIARLVSIARVLVRHDALAVLELGQVAPALLFAARLLSRPAAPGGARPGQRLAAALQELGPSFIKAGQVLSTRSDLLGEAFAADLAELRDQLPPFPAAAARATVAAELGHPVEALFAAFDDTPVAAASIAQVHYAVTTEGDEVAVKVLRPDIERAFGRDLDLFFWMAELIERTQPTLRRLRPVEVVRTIQAWVTIEMDMRMEAAAAEELAQNCAGDAGFQVPRVDWQRTARRVLTTERVVGIRIDERAALLAAGHDIRGLLTTSATVFFNQVFRDGFFHADLHPGNMFVEPDGTLVPVDFGIMGRLDRNTRRYLGEMLLSFLNRDYRAVAEVHFRAGYVPADQSLDTFTQACRSIGEPIFGRPLNEISVARLLGQLFQVTADFAMPTQPQLLLLQKTMLVAEGVGRGLDPEINIWQLAEPLIADWMREHLGPEARLADTVGEAVDALQRLPAVVAQVETVTAMVADGGLRLHPDSLRALRPEGRSGASWPLWLALAALALALVAVLR